jgi:hypothetical protein
MRIDPRPTLPEVLPAFQAYEGAALRPFLVSPATTEAVLEACDRAAVEHRDPEGLRLARRLRRLSGAQRRGLRALLCQERAG